MKASIFLKKLKSLKQDQLLEINGFGEIMASNFITYTKSPEFEELIGKLEALEQREGGGIEILSSQKTEEQKASLPLNNEVICITGSFDMSRDRIGELLEAKGAKIVNAITSGTTVLLAGEKAGSKLAKAQAKGIKIISDYTDILKN